MIPLTARVYLYSAKHRIQRLGGRFLRRIPVLRKILGISPLRISDTQEWIGRNATAADLTVVFPPTIVIPIEPKCPTCTAKPREPQTIEKHFNYWDPRSGFDSRNGFYRKPIERFDEVFLAKIPRACVLGPSGSILGPDRELFLESIWTWDNWIEIDRSQTAFRLPKPEHIQSSIYVVTSNFSEGYPHWVMEVLPRLFALHNLEIKPILIFQKDLVEWQLDTLDALGFGEYPKLGINGNFVTADSVYFPSYVGKPGTPHPDGCRWVRETILDRVGRGDHPKRIYITRRLATKRRVANEDDLLPLLCRYGFDIIEAENLSFNEQVRLFSTAECIVAPHGAGLTNLMWVPEGCKVLEILDRDYVNDHFYNLSSILNLDYYYQLADSVNAREGRATVVGRDDVFVDPTDFTTTLRIVLEE